MDFDMNQSAFGPIDPTIDFDVSFQQSRHPKHKYVLNNTTGEVVGVVGSEFVCASHPTFFSNVQRNLSEGLSEDELEGVNVSYKTARNGAWAMCDMNFPNVRREVATGRHKTDIGFRAIAIHGVDGSAGNNVIFGAIDFFCTNGIISGEHSKVRRKNTSLFTIDKFITRLSESRRVFEEETGLYQTWANKSLHTKYDKVEEVVKSLMPERSATKMLDLYAREIAVRGPNMWALASAFTNFSSHNEGNGFDLKKTNNDTQAINMFGRETKVSNWLESNEFNSLLAA